MRWSRIAVVAVALVVVVVLAFWLAVLPSRVLRAVRIPLGTTPASLGVAFSNVSFPTRGGGLSLRGWWMPAPAAKGVVIFVHGGNDNRRDFHPGGMEMQAFLTRQHLSVLAFDLRNHGQSDATPDGQITLGIEEANDALGAVDYVAAKGLPIYLLADSMGGAVAIYAAADDARIKRLALIDPVLNAKAAEIGALHATTGLPRLLLPPVVWSARTFFAHAVRQRDALAEGEHLRLPVLLIQDDRDPICPPVFANQLAAANRNVRLWISHDPDDGNGAWGHHVGAYRLHRGDVERLLSRFLAG